MRFVDKIVQDIEVAFEPLHSSKLDDQDFEIEIPFSKDNDNFWTSLNNELDSKGIAYRLLDTYETDKTTIYYVMLRRKWKPEYYDEGVNRKIKLYIKEATNGRYWVTDDDYIPLYDQPEEGYTQNQAILRAQKESEELSRLFHEPVSKTVKYFHIMDSNGNIVHELDSAI